MSRPLVDFREAVRELLSQGIAPTPQAMAENGYGRWVNIADRTFKDGHLAKAREEEFLSAGWRRVAFKESATTHNFRWVSVDRKRLKGVQSKFRPGDTVKVYTGRGEDHGAIASVTGCQGLTVNVQIGRKQVSMYDADLILLIPSEDYPLR